jgi:hypothetical protein
MIRKVIRRHHGQCVAVPRFRCLVSVSMFLVVSLFPLENLQKLHQTGLELRTSAHCSLRGFGGLEAACWPLVPKFAGSNPAETVGFFRAKKSPVRLTSEGK